jgi:hypothetical protein
MEFLRSSATRRGVNSEFFGVLPNHGLKIRFRVTGVRVRVPLALPHKVAILGHAVPFDWSVCPLNFEA